MDHQINSSYKDLLCGKYQFIIFKTSKEYICLTKEKSLFKITDLNEFIEKCRKDEYYKSVREDIHPVNENDLKIYYKYLDEFKDKLTKNLYGSKYLFGSVAIKSGKGFITTVRGKEDLKDYSYVNYVNHKSKIVSVKDKKATLNAPLLATLFENQNVEAIVHINHEYDNDYKYDFFPTGGLFMIVKKNNQIKRFNICSLK